MADAIRNRSTGMDLRLRRVALGVAQTTLARQLGVSRQRIANVEGMYRPPRPMVERYLAALDAAAAER